MGDLCSGCRRSDTISPVPEYEVLVLLGASPNPQEAILFADPDWTASGFRISTLDDAEGSVPSASLADIVVIGSGVPDARRAGSAFRRRLPAAQILILVPQADVVRVRMALPFTPDLAGSLVMPDTVGADELRSTLRKLIEAGRQDQKLTGLYARMNDMVRDRFHDSGMTGDRQRQLVVAERYLATILNHVPEALFATDLDGNLVQLNRAAETLLGPRDATIGRPLAEFGGTEFRELVPTLIGRAASGETVDALEVRLDGLDGQQRVVELGIAPVSGTRGSVEGLSFSAHDITHRRNAEDALRLLADSLELRVEERTRELAAANASLIAEMGQRETAEEALRQAQKMEAVGQLTGGLAHDFNNLLAGISGSLEMMQARIRQGRVGELDRYMIGAQGAAKRAAALTHRLLAFSRRQTLDPKPTDVNRLVGGMEDLIRRTVGPQVAVETVATGGLWSTLVDPNQLENALLNLCINARDAMPDGGKLTIETGNRWLDDRAARERDLPPGQYVSMCVSDNGTGMPADVIERAFDPFFTTKPIGVGTGLGLSMIYGFARQSGGQVRICSEVGDGTMVCVYLPRHHTSEETAEEVYRSASLERVGSGETVLVIDDEPLVRMLVVDVLEDLGYTAIEAGDGPSGLKVLRSDVRIDLLITDVGLPNGMNGRQVADAARELRPDLKVLFVTGYAENAVLSHGHLGPGMQVVTKPFDMIVLADRIKAMINP